MSLSNHDKKRQMPRVAVIGIGTMGTAMARRLLGSGMKLDVWSRHAASTKPLVDAGAGASDQASDAVERADVVMTMPPNAE
jgi:3-hydroxyisobutyrate dehydrogenase